MLDLALQMAAAATVCKLSGSDDFGDGFSKVQRTGRNKYDSPPAGLICRAEALAGTCVLAMGV